MTNERIYLGHMYTYAVLDTPLVSLPQLEEAMSPDKSVMLTRYQQAYADFAAIKDDTSDDGIYARTYRNQCRRAAMSCGATAEEIKAVEQAVKDGDGECRCVLPEQHCKFCTPERWDGETELNF